MRHNQDAAVAAATVADDARSALLADLLGRIAGCFPRRETRQSCSQMVRRLLARSTPVGCEALSLDCNGTFVPVPGTAVPVY